MAEIFHVYASHGRNNYVELDLPASGYEMLDMMERLRLEPGQLPYVEVLKVREEYDYLERCIHEQPDVYHSTPWRGSFPSLPPCRRWRRLRDW